MVVQDSVKMEGDEYYTLEFGISSWTEMQPPMEYTQSIRNKYDPEHENYLPNNGCEIPLADVEFIVRECMKRDKIDTIYLLNIIKEANSSIERQNNRLERLLYHKG